MGSGRLLHRWLAISVGLALPGLLTAACVIVEDNPSTRATGGVGESCGANRDCHSGLACVAHVCVDPDAGSTPEPVSDAGQEASADADTNADADAANDAPAQEAGIGGKCSADTECTPGLGCARGHCSGSEYGLVPSGNECVLVYCREAKDCCPSPPSSCDSWLTQCGEGSQYHCALYQDDCVCNESEWSCASDRCVYRRSCASSSDCAQSSSTPTCQGSVCVECTSADDCDSDEACVEGRCKFQCALHEQCPNFSECQSGACVHVGCATDSECITSTGNPLATCIDGDCPKPCVSDPDCNKGWNNKDNVCYRGSCYPRGCETDAECRIALESDLSGNREAECRAE